MARTSGNHRRHHVTTRLELFRTCHQTHKNLQYATNELSQNECVLPSDMMPTGLTTKKRDWGANLFRAKWHRKTRQHGTQDKLAWYNVTPKQYLHAHAIHQREHVEMHIAKVHYESPRRRH